MKVFISWSGNKSHKVAELLRDWLPNLFGNTIEPWISSQDIKAGQRGMHEIAEQLKGAGMGIICLTEQNLAAPWIQFEAGAISKSVKHSFVCPYLIELEVRDLPGDNPLAQFQAASADEDGTRKIVMTINDLVKNHKPERISSVFETWWPKLKDDLKDLPADDDPGVQKPRSQDDLLNELVTFARSQAYDSGAIDSRLKQIEKVLRQQSPARVLRGLSEALLQTPAPSEGKVGNPILHGLDYRPNARIGVQPQNEGGLGRAAYEPGEEKEG